MVQMTMRLRSNRKQPTGFGADAAAVGLKCEGEVVTLRFMANGPVWGEPAREVRIDRQLAERLTRMLVDELD